MMQGLKRVVPGDVVEQLGVVKKSVGYKLWDAPAKQNLGRAIKATLKGNHQAAIGYLKGAHAKLPRNIKVINQSIERLTELI